MSENFININGRIKSNSDLVLGLENRAFRYGDGLFESMRVINAELMFADLHSKRLMQSMQLLKMQGSEMFNKNFIIQKTEELLKSNKIFKDARIRWSVFRKEGGFYTPESNEVCYSIEVEKISTSGYQLNKKGLLLGVFDKMNKSISSYSGIKSSNALLYVLAGIEAKETGFDDLIILNNEGNIAETISSNIFLVKNDKLYTPSLSEGGIDGVMRKAILSIAKKNKIQITETRIGIQNLALCDEVFLTNAVQGLQWVMGFGEKRFFSKTSKLFTNFLNEQ